jgi:biotin carboxyl carrier protein
MRAHGSLADWSSSGARRSQVSLALDGATDAARAPEAAKESDAKADTSAFVPSRWDAQLEAAHDGQLAVSIGAHRALVRIASPDSISVDGRRQPIHVAFDGASPLPARMWLDYAGLAACVVDAASLPAQRTDATAGGELRARMHGRIASVAVTEGDRVNAGQALLSIEAMKMEHVVSAPASGRVAALAVSVGTQVSPMTLLARIEAEAA